MGEGKLSSFIQKVTLGLKAASLLTRVMSHYTKDPTMKIRVLCMVALFGILAGGCSRETEMPNSPDIFLEEFFVLNPSNGQTSVPLNAPIILSFAKPVDRSIVERSLFLISENAMADSLCPVSTTIGHGNMSDAMADSAKQHHLDRYHATSGKFLWNTESTRCTFQPDSLMTPRTSYMLRMNREMTQMFDQRMGSMGMMGGHGTGVMIGEMMFHFFTMDTTGLGGGHSGHH